MELNKILLVDDDPGFNFITKHVLKEHGVTCTIDSVLNGQLALDYIVLNGCPDVILLDINMPVMNAFEFLAEYEKLDKCVSHTKIYILSSSLRDADRNICLSWKFVNGYIEKPLTDAHIDEILATVKASS